MAGLAKPLKPAPVLVIDVEGSDIPRTITITDDEMIIGRRKSSDIVIDNPHVSRTHASISKVGGAIVLMDFKSTAGTFLNGELLVGHAALKHNDEILFGVVKATFQDRGTHMNDEDETGAIDYVKVDDRPVLSPRQLEVLRYLYEGLTNAEIAENLGVTERTVKAHCHEVFDRLDARNRTAAVATAMRMGLISE